MNINATLLGQVLTFVVLVWFTMKFVWPPLTRMLEERAKRIADGLAAAQQGKQELLDAESKVAAELKNVQLRANEVIANSEKRANQIIDAAKETAHIEADKIIINARAQIDQEFAKMKETLRLKMSDLVIRGAEQVLRAEIDKTRHEQILAQIKAEL